jgi:hypothetical protein
MRHDGRISCEHFLIRQAVRLATGESKNAEDVEVGNGEPNAEGIASPLCGTQKAPCLHHVECNWECLIVDGRR